MEIDRDHDTTPAKRVPFLARLRPEEAVGLLFLVVLVVLSLVASHTPTLRKVAGTNLLIVTGVVALVILLIGRRGSRVASTFRDWLPFAFCVLIYENLHDVVPLLNPGLCDPELVRIDRAILGGDAAVWAQQFASPALTRTMNLGYASYYVLPAILGGLLYVQRDRTQFRHLMLGIVFGLFLGYLGYMLVPTVGPRYYQEHLFNVTLEGDFFYTKVVGPLTRAHAGTLPRDCFPSLHAANALTVLGFALLYRRILGLVFTPVVLLLLASTIYLRYHYVIDLIAGTALACFMVWWAPRIDAAWARWTGRDST